LIWPKGTSLVDLRETSTTLAFTTFKGSNRMEHSEIRTAIAVTLLLTAATSAIADSMECNGNLVSSGDSQASVLENCGEPTSRNGDQWTYQVDDSLSKIVTFGGGVVLTISDGNFPGFQDTPFENQP
jgi:hypothetical protein